MFRLHSRSMLVATTAVARGEYATRAAANVAEITDTTAC